MCYQRWAKLLKPPSYFLFPTQHPGGQVEYDYEEVVKDDVDSDDDQAGTSWGESSKPDLFLNFILKVRMLRFSRHSRLKTKMP